MNILDTQMSVFSIQAVALDKGPTLVSKMSKYIVIIK